MVGARTVLRVGERLGEGSQGVVHLAVLPSGAAVAVKWYRETTASLTQRRAIAALIAHGRPHDAFLWPIDLVTSEQIRGFGYVMPLRDGRFISFAQMLSEPTQPSFRVLATIARELVDAFAALHFSGLSYRDISFGNLFVDPERATVAICDNDNVGTDSAPVAVYGTLRFMAPEIVRGEVAPSTVTDLHSLAVLLFYLFVHGHPLDGARFLDGWSGDGVSGDGASGDGASEEDRALRHYGTAPLFVFDPVDDANRPLPDDPMRVWWRIYPRFLRDLFTTAFTTGLRDASLSGRITEGVWRRTLLRLCDSVERVSGVPGRAFLRRRRTSCPVLELRGGRIRPRPARHQRRQRRHGSRRAADRAPPASKPGVPDCGGHGGTAPRASWRTRGPQSVGGTVDHPPGGRGHQGGGPRSALGGAADDDRLRAGHGGPARSGERRAPDAAMAGRGAAAAAIGSGGRSECQRSGEQRSEGAASE